MAYFSGVPFYIYPKTVFEIIAVGLNHVTWPFLENIIDLQQLNQIPRTDKVQARRCKGNTVNVVVMWNAPCGIVGKL